MNTCDICLKHFKRRDNMLRHKRTKHAAISGKGISLSEQSDEETQSMSVSESGDSDGETTTLKTNHGISETSDTELGGDKYDPWESVVQKAFNKCQAKFEEEVAKLLQTWNVGETEARRVVYQDMRSTYRKAISDVFIARIMWFNAMRKHPVYKAIRKTAANLVELDDYNPEEALKSAVGQRKYLFDTILAEFYPPELDGVDSEEPSEKMAKVN